MTLLQKLFGKFQDNRASQVTQATSQAPAALQPSANNLVVRIKHQNFLRALHAHGVPETQMPYTQPLCGELIVSYAFDMPQEFIMATPGLLEQAGVTSAQVRDHAVQNTAVQVNDASVRIIPDDGGCLLRVGNPGTFTNLEACCLLHPGALALLKEELQPEGQMLLCAPTRNYLFALDSARPQSHAKAMEAAQMMYDDEEPTHRLSLQWMVQDDEGWQVVQLG